MLNKLFISFLERYVDDRWFLNKEHPHYMWVKYNIYKKIRNPICNYRFAYNLSDEENTKIRREQIMKLKNN